MASNEMLIRVGLKGAKAVQSGLKGITRSVGTSTKAIAKFATNWRTALVGITALGGALRTASRFSDGMREIQTIGKQSSEELKELGSTIRNVSAEFGQDFSATTKAQYDIISAGVQGTERQLETLRAASQLAVAGVSDIGTTADVITSAMNSYGQEVMSAGKASDILFQTVEKGKTTIPELGASLGQVMPFASSAGVSLESVGAAMATITAGGVATSEATTALKTAIVALDTPTARSRKAFEELGFEVTRMEDGSLDLVGTMAQLEKFDSATIQRLVPNVTAQLAIKSITKDMDGFRDTMSSFDNIQNKTAEAVKTVNMSLGQQGRILGSNLKNAMIEIGGVIGEQLVNEQGTGPLNKINESLQNIGRIGWSTIARRVIDSFSAIWTALKETTALLLSRAFGQIPGLLMGALRLAMDLIKKVAVFIWEPIGKQAKILGLSVKLTFESMINGVISLVNGMINTLNKLPGVSITNFEQLKTNTAGQIETLQNTTTAFGELFKEKQSSIADELGNIWGGLNAKIFAANEERKTSENAVTDVVVGAQAQQAQAIAKTTEETNKGTQAQQKQFQTTLSGIRNSITAFLAQAIAKAVSAEASKGIVGLVTGTAVAVGLTALFDKYIPKFAKGGEFITDRPQLFMAGDNPGGRERITVEPLSSSGFQKSGKNIVVNINAPLVDETVRDSILPSIQKAIKLDLA